MSWSIHVDNKGKDILILGKCPTQGLGEYSLTAEKMYSVNFFLIMETDTVYVCITMEQIVIIC